MRNKILERVDEAIENIRPVVEERMPYRKWKMHVELLWDDTFGVLFEYNEDLSDSKNGKIIKKYELSNQFWYSEAKPDIIEYTLFRFTEKEKEEVKKEEIPIGSAGRFQKTEPLPPTEESQEESQEEFPIES